MADQLTAKTDDAHVELQVDLKDPNVLLLKYKFSNKTPRAIFLFNGIYTTIGDDGYEVDPNRTYIRAIGEDEILICKKVPPLPAQIDVEKRLVPCATRIAPGESFTESIELKLPLVQFFPYIKAIEPPAPAIDDGKLYFELGFIDIPEEGEPHVKPVVTTIGGAFMLSSFKAERQKLVRIGPLPVTADFTPMEKKAGTSE